MPPQITQYEHLTEDELLHLATQRVQLSDEARLRLDDELSRRGPGAEQIRTYSDETEVLREAERASGQVEIVPRRRHYILWKKSLQLRSEPTH